MNCTKCGAELMPEASFCTSCGANVNETAPQYYAPALKFPTNRSFLKFFFLSLITFGIYGLVIWSRIPDELNIAASRYDGKKTCPFFSMYFLGHKSGDKSND